MTAATTPTRTTKLQNLRGMPALLLLLLQNLRVLPINLKTLARGRLLPLPTTTAKPEILLLLLPQSRPRSLEETDAGGNENPRPRMTGSRNRLLLRNQPTRATSEDQSRKDQNQHQQTKPKVQNKKRNRRIGKRSQSVLEEGIHEIERKLTKMTIEKKTKKR